MLSSRITAASILLGTPGNSFPMYRWLPEITLPVLGFSFHTWLAYNNEDINFKSNVQYFLSQRVGVMKCYTCYSHACSIHYKTLWLVYNFPSPWWRLSCLSGQMSHLFKFLSSVSYFYKKLSNIHFCHGTPINNCTLTTSCWQRMYLAKRMIILL